jgi:dihydroneopterin aldolase
MFQIEMIDSKGFSDLIADICQYRDFFEKIEEIIAQELRG